MTQETPTPETDALERKIGLSWFGITAPLDRAQHESVMYRDLARSLERRLQEAERLLAANEGRVKHIVDEQLLARCDAAEARASEAERERDAVKELLSIHNLGGMTDYNDGPMKRALAAEARADAMAGLLRTIRNMEWGKKQAWIVNGPPDKETGIAAAKEITAMNVRIDAALSHPLGGKT